MSIWLDLKIMLKTGTVMAGQLFESRQGRIAAGRRLEALAHGR